MIKVEANGIIEPIARAYGVERVALFGSYARGEATPNSDIDLHIDKGAINAYIKLCGFQQDLEDQLQMSVDVFTTGALVKDQDFLNRIKGEEVVLYEQRQVFGGFGSFPITLRSEAMGKSEVYHK